MEFQDLTKFNNVKYKIPSNLNIPCQVANISTYSQLISISNTYIVSFEIFLIQTTVYSIYKDIPLHFRSVFNLNQYDSLHSLEYLIKKTVSYKFTDEFIFEPNYNK